MTATWIDCVEWQGARFWGGYGCWPTNEFPSRRAHRVVMAEIHGWDALEGKIVMHLCDNPPCVNPDHLRIGTDADNSADRDRKGRHGFKAQPGEANGRSKLTGSEVREIRLHMRLHDFSTSELADLYGVSQSTIRLIRRGERWPQVAA